MSLGARLLPAIKGAQLLNVAWSAGLCVVLLLLAERIRPGRQTAKRLALAVMGLVAVYPRTFSFFRAEPLLAFLATLGLLLALRLWDGEGGRTRPAITLGLVLGLMMLARQQGVFVLATVGALALARAAAEPARRGERLRALATTALVTAVVGGGFYLSLWARFGSPLAFNKKQDSPSLDNRPPEFLTGTGDGLLFTDPIRPSFKGQLLPVLYADAWGDYYGYFLVYAWDKRRESYIPQNEWEGRLERVRERPWLDTNRFAIAPYLGRVNALALLPVALLAWGLVLGLTAVPRIFAANPAPAEGTLAVLAMAVVLTLAGYTSVLLTLPVEDLPGRPQSLGTTIKATYVIQVLPWLALLGAEAAERLRDRKRSAYRLLVVALSVVFLHNARTLFTVYGSDPVPTAGPRSLD